MSLININIKQAIVRAKNLNISIPNTAHILDLEPEYIKQVLQTNGHTSNRMPGAMPNSYFIERLTLNYTIQQMASELKCTRAAIYQLLKDRDIHIDAYRTTDTSDTSDELE